MRKGMAKYLDPWSAAVIAITLALFVLALFLKGLTHDFLLEGGVFLVSAKLVAMSYKNSALGEQLQERLDEIQRVLRQLQDRSRAK